MNVALVLVLAAAGLLMAPMAGAQQRAPGDPGPERVEMKLDRCRLVWRAHQGLDVEYGGAPVFTAYPDELTVHTTDWKRVHYRSASERGSVRLTRRGATQMVAVEHVSQGFRWTETIAAGPGDRFRIEYKYVQNAWDDASLQLGFSRPMEQWFAGASFDTDAASKRADGVIPMQFDPARPHPFDGATRLSVKSLFGQVEIRTTKPVSWFDYERRDGHFWLGLDEVLPKGRAGTFAIELRLSPAVMEGRGILLSHLSLPAEVEDGRLAVSLTVRATEGGPERVKLTLAGASPRSEHLETTREVSLPKGKDTAVELALPALTPGNYAYRLVVTAEPSSAELLATRELSAHALPLVTVTPGRSLYTWEDSGCLLVTVSQRVAGPRLRFIATGEGGLRLEADVRAGALTRVPLDVAALPQGATRVTGRLERDGQPLGVAEVVVRKAPPKPNEVKIDYESRGLIVEGLPWLPFGFYCIFPPGELAAAEAPQGFNMIAAYQNVARDGDQIRAYLDRCAQVGMKVHYDIRALAQSEPSEAKWAALRREVEMFRDHPALLAWYLCDEPDGQGIPPERLVEAYNFVKELDPYHPITMVFCIPARAPDYVAAMDILMADPYPIPQASVTTVAEWAEQLNRAVGKRMPLWIVPQAFGGGEAWRREPTAREERAMTYLALVHGATGIQYFIRRPTIGNPISPSLWSECRRLALEAQELAPVLLSAEDAPSASADSEKIHVTSRRYRGAVYVIAVNTEGEPAPIAISIAGRHSGDAEVLFEARKVALSRGRLQDMIDGFGTRVYRIPIEAPAEPVGISPDNLTVNPGFEDAANVGTPDGCYVSAGPDPGASVFVDPRVAYHGAHSLRLRTPTQGAGVTIMPFPVALEKGRRYAVSIWAKGQMPGLRFRLGLSGIGVEPQVFEPGTSWARYELSGVANEDRRGQLTLELTSAGVAWFDLIQVVAQ